MMYFTFRFVEKSPCQNSFEKNICRIRTQYVNSKLICLTSGFVPGTCAEYKLSTMLHSLVSIFVFFAVKNPIIHEDKT
jgi:hypothetical protein